MKNALVNNVQKAYGSVEQMNPSHFYSKATILDPRYKKVAFTSTIHADGAVQAVQFEVSDILKNNCKFKKILILTI